MRKLSKDVAAKRLKTMMETRSRFEETVDNLHVKLQKGNSKTGANCWTTSFLPIIDCPNHKHCMDECYDHRNDCRFINVIKDRARNSAIHKHDRARYWREVDQEIKDNIVRELRINVGGDLDNEDFAYVAELGRNNPRTMILFFTKNYDGINAFLDNNEFPENVKPIMSAWKNLEMNNPHNLPCSHVLYDNGDTTAPEYGAIYCGGNCSRCAFEGNGCWYLKKGEHVIFREH